MDGKFNIFTGLTSWAPISCELNQWHFICVVYKTTNVLFYKNNVEYLLGSAPSGQESIYNLNIGRNSYNGGSEYYSGNIPTIQVYNRALSDSEIKQNFEALRGRYGI